MVMAALLISWGSRKGRAGTVGAKGNAALFVVGVDLGEGLDFLVDMPHSFPDGRRVVGVL